jgi:molybdopterin-binding protein
MQLGKYNLTMMSLELSQDIKVDIDVELTLKPTSVVLAKEISGEISFSNHIKAKVSEIVDGKLLSSIILDIDGSMIESIITKNSKNRLDIKLEDMLDIYIKASDISIKRVVNA